jgi:hypothetical protein
MKQMHTCCPNATLQRLSEILWLPNLTFQILLTSPLPLTPLTRCAESQQEDPGSKKRDNDGVLLTFWWAIWIERNIRVFESSELSAPTLAIDVITRFRMTF